MLSPLSLSLLQGQLTEQRAGLVEGSNVAKRTGLQTDHNAGVGHHLWQHGTFFGLRPDQLDDGSLVTAYALTAYLKQPPDVYVTETVRWRLP